MIRDLTLERMSGHRYDVAIIGGGINGAVSAAALAGRGASVALVERADFGGATSQESSNLVWGGIKYLQSYELPLVWSLCSARNKLMRSFPTRIRQLPFLAAIGQTTPFSLPLGALGVAGYWILGRGRTSPPRAYSSRRAAENEPLIAREGLRGAVQYHDALLVDNDARFVWDFVGSAVARGAAAVNYTELRGAERGPSGWRLDLVDRRAGTAFQVDADIVVNAGGPFAPGLSSVLDVATRNRLVFSKGVHLVVPRIGANDRVLAFFDDDSRLFYVIPMHDRSMIGTTDTRVAAHETSVTDHDRRFILDQANRRLALERPLTVDDIVSERCGVRPLVVSEDGPMESQDWMALSRRHEVEVDPRRRVVTILGGKLTDCLNVGGEVTDIVRQLGVSLGPDHKRWYGEDDARLREQLFALPRRRPASTPGPRAEELLAALWRRQGARSLAIAERWASEDGADEVLFAGTDLTRAELHQMVHDEMVVELDDLLRRRTPLSLIRSRDELAGHDGTAELSALVNDASGGGAVPRVIPGG